MSEMGGHFLIEEPPHKEHVADWGYPHYTQDMGDNGVGRQAPALSGYALPPGVVYDVPDGEEIARKPQPADQVQLVRQAGNTLDMLEFSCIKRPHTKRRRQSAV